MALISSLAMWLGKNDGNVIIEWFDWEITTKPAFFLLFLITISFITYLFVSLLKQIFSLPILIKKKIIQNRFQNAQQALYKGIIASSYGNKEEVFKNFSIAKKNLKNSALLLLLELQNSILKKNDKDTFSALTKLLSDDTSKPLAIKGLISYAKKKKDIELFNNMLDKSLSKKINFNWINQDVVSLCIENNNWISLSQFLEKKFSMHNKKYRYMLSLVNYHIAKNYYLRDDNIKAKNYLQKAINLNKYFPPIIDLYCKLNMENNDHKIIKKLKDYWQYNPHPNIETCINSAFNNMDEVKKLNVFIKVLNKNDDLHLKHLLIGKLKYKAKIWGDSKKDLKKSIALKPSKEAYYYLYKIEKKFSVDNKIINNLESLYNETKEDFIWKCDHCKSTYNDWNLYCLKCKSFDSLKFNSQKFKNFNFETQNPLINNINVKL